MPARATRRGELWAHLAASTLATPPSDGPVAWIEHPDVGPCARCRQPTVRYGPAGAPLCTGCARGSAAATTPPGIPGGAP